MNRIAMIWSHSFWLLTVTGEIPKVDTAPQLLYNHGAQATCEQEWPHAPILKTAV